MELRGSSAFAFAASGAVGRRDSCVGTESGLESFPSPLGFA